MPSQVPDHFSFVVKAPALVCDAVMRDEEGRGKVPNPHFLDAAIAAREFVVPCLEGLAPRRAPWSSRSRRCRAAWSRRRPR